MPKTKLIALDFGSRKYRPISHLLILDLFKILKCTTESGQSLLRNKKIISEHFPEASVTHYNVFLYSTLSRALYYKTLKPVHKISLLIKLSAYGPHFKSELIPALTLTCFDTQSFSLHLTIYSLFSIVQQT